MVWFPILLAARTICTRSDPTYSGHATVPVLLDNKTSTIVNNVSSVIIRMFNTAFDGIGAKAGYYYPEALRTEIDGLNARIYATVNNGGYRAGFATTQEAYEAAVGPLFETLDWLRRIADCPRLSDYMRTLFRIEGVAATVNLGHIKRHYYQSQRILWHRSGRTELAFMSSASAK